MILHDNAMDLETVEQRTGGGGSQKLYRAPPEWTAPTNKTLIGVDIRGQGGSAMPGAVAARKWSALRMVRRKIPG